MESVTCNTLADFPTDKYSILLYCCACERRAEVDREMVPPDITVPDLRERLVCSACGSRETMLHIVWHGGRGSPFSAWGRT